MGAPAVSVAIIAYNAEAYLAEAIDSVVAQDISDYELILVDDGSTDSTRGIAAAACARLGGKARLLQHAGGRNRGMSRSRNLALADARGEHIAFLDADDVWAPQKLREQLAVFSAEPDVGLVYGRARIWRSWAGGEDFFYDLGVTPDQVQPPPDLFLSQLPNRRQTPTTSGSMLRTALARRLGGFENRFRGMFEDQVFFAKVLLEAPAYVSSAAWFSYRQHPASASARSEAAGRDELARLAYLDWLAAYLRKVRAPREAHCAVEAERASLRAALRRRRLRAVGAFGARTWSAFR